MGTFFPNIGKTIRKLDPLRAGGADIVGEKLGLSTATGKGSNNILDMGATAAADAAAQAAADRAMALATQQEADRKRAEQDALLNAMNKNMAQDLKAENRTQVIAGGTAAYADQTAEDIRKRRAGLGLSSTLGINT